MKVSEAVARIKSDASTVWKDDNVCVVLRSDIQTLLASHEALRLAGGAVTYSVSAEAIEALSRAVEEASE